MESFRAVVLEAVDAVNEWSIRYRKTEDIEIIFIFQYRFYTFCYPYVNDSICDHACITAGTGGTERVIVINVKLIVAPLQDQPWFVVWSNGASAMELGNIKGASLCALRSKSNLQERDEYE